MERDRHMERKCSGPITGKHFQVGSFCLKSSLSWSWWLSKGLQLRSVMRPVTNQVTPYLYDGQCRVSLSSSLTKEFYKREESRMRCVRLWTDQKGTPEFEEGCLHYSPERMRVFSPRK